jgi:hypothetical protein
MGPASQPDEDERPLAWQVERQLTESHAVLWAVVIVSSIFDVVTTITGLSLGLTEGNAVAQAFIATYGTSGIGLLKFIALFLLILTWSALPDRSATYVLSGFAVVSLFTITLNAITLAGL